MKKKGPLVSVIIPTHNRCELLQEAVQSVLLQKYRPLEIIIVDDGSTDETQLVVDEVLKIQASDVYIDYFRQDNMGASVARDQGLKRCKGEYVQFLDSDDLLHCDKIMKQVDMMMDLDLDLVTCEQEYFEKIPGDLGVVHRFCTSKEDLLAGFILESAWNSSTVLYSREVLKYAGVWNTSLKIMQDFEYSCRVCMLSPQIGHISDVLFYYRRNHDCISNQADSVRMVGVFEALVSVMKKVSMHQDVYTPMVRRSLAKRFRWVYSGLKDCDMRDIAKKAWCYSWKCGSIKQRIQLLVESNKLGRRLILIVSKLMKQVGAIDNCEW